MRIRLFVGTILLALLASRSLAGESRMAAPTAEQEAKLREAVRTQYSDMFASPARADQIALCKLLLQASGQAQTPDQEFALLCEASDAAARSGDIAGCDRICQALVAKYALSLGTARANALTAGAGSVAGQPEQDDFFLALTKAIDQSLLADDFEPARRMLEIGSTTAANLGAGEWERMISVRQVDFNTQLKAFASTKPAMDRLRQNPSDAASSLMVGKYECFIKGDWQTGLALLDHGNDDNLGQIARVEIWEPINARRSPENGRLQFMVADGWEGLAQSMPEYSTQLHLHAYDWYLRSLPHIPNPDSDDGMRVESQLAALVPLVEGRRQYPAMWPAIAQALSRKYTFPSKIAGGSQAVERFENIPELGGLLIGFHVSFAMLNSQKVITYLQPIYATPTGQQDGPAFGKQYSKLQTVRAPIGYAIGAIKVCGGAGIDSITPAFMRIHQNRLNPADTLPPIRIGGTGGAPEILDGHGTPIIGICGKQKDGYLGLGVVYDQPIGK